jgi:hypothetical protein
MDSNPQNIPSGNLTGLISKEVYEYKERLLDQNKLPYLNIIIPLFILSLHLIGS